MSGAALLRVESLSVLRGARAVLTDVSFELMPGEALGLIGRSGSGKSTLLRALGRLVPVKARRLEVLGRDFLSVSGRSLREHRGALAYVFQEPRASLNPRRTVSATIEEAASHAAATQNATRPDVQAWLARVGLAVALAQRRPAALSLGQCQRVQLARALAQNPRVLLLDEPSSALDPLATRALVALLLELRASGVALVIASHDLALIESLCARTLVLEAGRVVEFESTRRVLDCPASEAARALGAARLPLSPVEARRRLAPEPVR